MSAIRILLCDDQDIVTEGLQMILSSVADFEVIGVTHDGAEAVDAVAAREPDIVLKDLKMPIMNGIQATRKIRQAHPDVDVLVLTTYDDDEWVFDAIRAGACGYLLKDTPRDQLIAAIRGTVGGATYIDPNVAGKLLKQVAQPGLSAGLSAGMRNAIGADLNERELDVLRLLTDGLSNADIAERLYLSKGTVQNYVSNIFVKLDVSDRTQAAVLALRHGLVD